MKKLIKGIVNFRKNHKNDYCDKFSQLSQRHEPDALFVACCDSRVVPNIFASSDPGDLFVLRNIGNIIPPYEEKNISDLSVHVTIEFALRILNVKDIIICGHSECGAMKAIINEKFNKFEISEHTKSWLKYAQTSLDIFLQEKNDVTKIDTFNKLSQINVLQQLENLKTYPLVLQRINNNSLKIHGWWFDLSTAEVLYYKNSDKKFTVINESELPFFMENTNK